MVLKRKSKKMMVLALTITLLWLTLKLKNICLLFKSYCRLRTMLVELWAQDKSKEREPLKENKKIKKMTRKNTKEKPTRQKRKLSKLSSEEFWFCYACKENYVSYINIVLNAKYGIMTNGMELTKDNMEFFFVKIVMKIVIIYLKFLNFFIIKRDTCLFIQLWVITCWSTLFLN